MKILHVITGLDTGGTELTLYRLLSHLDLKAHRVSVVNLKGLQGIQKQLEDLGVSVTSLHVTSFLGVWRGLFQLAAHIRSFQPDVIHSWLVHGNVAARLAKGLAFCSAPLIWSIRYTLGDIRIDVFTNFLIRLGAFLSKGVDGIIYNSRLSRRQHEDRGYAEAVGCLIPNGVDTDLFRPSEEARTRLRRELGAGEDDVLIGWVGRDHPDKDPDTFIKAARAFAPTHKNVRFLMAGRGMEGSNKRLKNLMGSDELQKRFHLLGERKDVPVLMAGLDLLTISSRAEALPNVLLEGMACQVPVVASRVGDVADVLQAPKVLFPPGDGEQLALVWKAWLKRSPGTRRAILDANHRRVVDNYSLESMAQQYWQRYARLIEEGERRRYVRHRGAH